MENILLSLILALLLWHTLPDSLFESDDADSDDFEQPRKAALDQVIGLHLHPEDRTYLLSRIDEAGDQGEIDSVLLMAQKIAAKHPLGMNI